MVRNWGFVIAFCIAAWSILLVLVWGWARLSISEGRAVVANGNRLREIRFIRGAA
jgi:hypothetical protein